MAAPGAPVAPGAGEPEPESRYERAVWEMQHDPKWLKEVSLGKRIGLYRFQDSIGSGNFSHVKLAMHQLTRDKVAIKIIDKTKLDNKTRKMIAQEIKTMEAVHHPNIIRLFEVVDTYRKIHLVTEYASCGELYTRVSTEGRMEESAAKHLFLQVVQAVKHMHNMGFVHRDIKAENVFYSSPTVVKLGDFGFSTELPNDPRQRLNTFCGSPPYAAPELFRDDSYVGQLVDVWALGVLLFFMVTANMPFRASTISELKKFILEGTFTIPQYVSEHCRCIIEKTLVQTAVERMPLDEIMENEWFHKPKPNARLRKNSLMFLAKKFRRGPTAPSALNGKRSLIKDLELKRIPELRNNKTADMYSVGEQLKYDELEAVKINNFTTIKAAQSKGQSFDVAMLPSSHPSVMLKCPDGSPIELGRFIVYPTAVQELNSLNPLERKTREKLQGYGITSDMLIDHLAHGSKSPVLGIYRIVINRILTEEYLWESLNDPLNLVTVKSKAKVVKDGGPRKECVRSKLANVCVIL